MGKKRIIPRTEAKVAVLREHLFLLTGDVTEAIILNQLMYWTDIVNKNDEQLIEEIEELEKQGKIEIAKEKENQIREGWFYKSINKLSDEIMIAAPSTVGKKLQSLEEKGLIHAKRTDDPCEPKYYKVNLTAVRTKLLEIGFTLKGEIIDLQKVEQAEIKGQRKVAKGSRKKKKEQGNDNPSPIEKPFSNREGVSPIENPPSLLENPPSLLENKKITLKDHLHKSIDDDAPVDSDKEEWESDIDFLSFRKRFTEAGADDILIKEKGKEAYKAFKAIKAKLGFPTLISLVDRYIKETGKNAQILWFLGDGEKAGYKQYLSKKKADKPTRAKEADKLPRAIAEAEKVAEGQPAAEMDEEAQKAIREKIALLMQNRKKAK